MNIYNEELTTIKLSGSLARMFERTHYRVIPRTKDVIKALCVTVPGFEQYLITSKARGVTFAIFKGKRNISKDDLDNTNNGKEIHIVPVIIGSKRAGMFQTVLGVALLAVAVWNPAFLGMSANIAFAVGATGASMALGGVSQMLSPQTTGLRSRQDPDNKPSYAFGGPVNTTAQGNPVGVGYGQREIGGAIISAGIYTEDQQ